ncbi:MAG: hypothetical protein U0X74_00420 [Anaerolineales bacterium]
MNTQFQNMRSFLANLFLKEKKSDSPHHLSREQDFTTWKNICEEILAKPFPPQSSDFPDETLERDSRLTFSKSSNWEIICEEILDTEHSHVYHQRCLDELRRRGKSEQEIFEMRRLAWQTAGWLNFPMMAWEWINLDEWHILRAIEWLYDYKQISQEQRNEFENFVKLHAG